MKNETVEQQEHSHHHHHHHHHSSSSHEEKITWRDLFSKPKYGDDTSRMRFYMEKNRKLRGFKRRVIFLCVLGVAVVVIGCVFFAYFIDR